MQSELERFVRNVKIRRKENTGKNRAQDVKRFDEWLEGDVEELDDRDIKEYIAYLVEKGYSSSVIQSSVWTLNVFFDELYDDEEDNPVQKVDLSRYRNVMGGSKKKEYIDARGGIFALEHEGIKKLTENAPTPKLRNRLIINLMYHTGVRCQELCDMKIEHVDRNERRILVYSSKLDSEHIDIDPERPVWYGPSFDPLMDIWLDGGERDAYQTASSPYLFISQRSERINEYTVNDVIREAAENAGIQEKMYEDAGGRPRYLITSHTLRHSFARACMTPNDNGARIDLVSLARLMGHSDTKTTEQYLIFAEEDIKDARALYGPR